MRGMARHPYPSPDGTGRVLFVDLETTAFPSDDPTEPGASLLEVGMVITDDTPDLAVIAEANLLIRPPGTQVDHDRIFARMVPEVRDMHERSGLWTEATTGSDAWPVTDAEQALVGWLTEHGITAEHPAPMAGSGVSHFDDRWLRAHLPRVRLRGTYWTLDAGQIRRFLQYARRGDLVDLPGDVEAKPHRALGDARLHVVETRRYLTVLQGRGPREDVPSPS